MAWIHRWQVEGFPGALWGWPPVPGPQLTSVLQRLESPLYLPLCSSLHRALVILSPASIMTLHFLSSHVPHALRLPCRLPAAHRNSVLLDRRPHGSYNQITWLAQDPACACVYGKLPVFFSPPCPLSLPVSLILAF